MEKEDSIVDVLGKQIKAHDERFDAIDNDLGVLKHDVTTIKQDVSGLKQDVGSLKDDMRQVLKLVTQTHEDVSKLVMRSNAHEEDIVDLIARVEVIEEKVGIAN